MTYVKFGYILDASGGIMKIFYWRHLETGRTGTTEFNETHADEAGSDWMPGGVTKLAALFLVNKWNSMSDAWKYWVV